MSVPPADSGSVPSIGKPTPDPRPLAANSDADSNDSEIDSAIETVFSQNGQLESSGFAGMLAADPAVTRRISTAVVLLSTIGLTILGLVWNNTWILLAASSVALLISLRVLWLPIKTGFINLAASQSGLWLIAGFSTVIALIGLFDALEYPWIKQILAQADWNAIGALGEVFGALGQILIALLAVYVAWRQYVIEKDLTTQQNTITQQQTIDSYFQGISDLVLDEEGLLEDWPQERAIAEGRTAAIISSVDAGGKSKIIRFLSRARLLTPLRRDQRLGRAILDGKGGYEEDRAHGVRVIDLGITLAGADLSHTDLRWTDLSGTNLIRANLNGCDLVKANLSRTILVEAKLRGADLNGTRLFYGKAEAASPRSRTEPPNYRTGEHTGAVIENADLTGATQLSPEQRYYCCAWGGTKTRRTVPGGCGGVPNKLGA
jgi:uncharacterized protein YjbI with pentapeptide repeats